MVVNHVDETAKIGTNVKIWHFAYVGKDTELGDNVMIGSCAHVDLNVKIGAGTRIQGNAHISAGSRIGRNVFIGPSVTFTNDPYPPSGRRGYIKIEDNVVIGAGAVLYAGITIWKNSVIGMGSVVTRDVPRNAVVIGAPARIHDTREHYDAKQKAWKDGSNMKAVC